MTSVVALEPRHDPAALLATYELDPDRCDLVVEGISDRHFLEWLVGSSKDPKAAIMAISEIEMPDVGNGGARGRLMALAREAPGTLAPLRFLADADFDRLEDAQVPPNVWLTDRRDLEGYLVRSDCLEKIWRLALASNLDEQQLLDSLVCAAKEIMFLRMASRRLRLDLPFAETDLRKRVVATQRSVEVDVEKLARALLQNGLVSLSELDSLLSETRKLARSEHHPDHDLIHGKDYLELLGEVLLKCGVSREDSARCVWSSFERVHAQDYPVLTAVVTYLQRPGPESGIGPS